jgi:hypothetical protein
MSHTSATSTPRLPLPAPPYHPAFREFPIPHKHTIDAKRDPFFSIPYPLFSIPNFSHPLSFVTTAHFLPKTPASSIGMSKEVFWLLGLACLTPIDATSSKITPSNPFRIYFFHKTGRGVGSAQFLQVKRRGDGLAVGGHHFDHCFLRANVFAVELHPHRGAI